MRGFTLVELVLVLLILGILAATAIPRVPVSPVGVDAAARKIRSDLQYARSLAMTRGRNHGIEFTTAAPYVLYDQTPSSPVLDPLSRTAFSEDLRRFGRSQVTTSLRVEFDSWGRPTLTGGGSVTVSNGSFSRTLNILPETGFVTMGVGP